MELRQYIEQCPLFSELPGPVLEALGQSSKKIQVSAGDEIFTQGDSCEGFYLLAEGSVKVYRLNAAGRELVLTVVKVGETFGEAAVFTHSAYPANTQALEDSLLIFFPEKAFLGLIQKYPDIALLMLTGLSKRLRHLSNMLEDTVLTDVDTRVARFLFKTAKSLFYDSKSQPCVVLPMQKQVMALHLGTTPPTLSRALSRLEEAKLIIVRDNEIQFLDLPRLEQYSAGS